MIYLGIVAIIFCVELVIKTWVEKKGKIGSTKELCGGKLLLKKHHNKGAMLNFGEKKQKLVAFISLILTLFLTLAAVLFGEKGTKLLKVGLAMVLGGAYSNTYDRLFRTYVVDYVSFGVKNQ